MSSLYKHKQTNKQTTPVHPTWITVLVMHAAGLGASPGSSSRLFIAPKQLQPPHVLNFSVLIKLLNGCHITPGHQED